MPNVVAWVYNRIMLRRARALGLALGAAGCAAVLGIHDPEPRVVDAGTEMDGAISDRAIFDGTTDLDVSADGVASCTGCTSVTIVAEAGPAPRVAIADASIFWSSGSPNYAIDSCTIDGQNCHGPGVHYPTGTTITSIAVDTSSTPMRPVWTTENTVVFWTGDTTSPSVQSGLTRLSNVAVSEHSGGSRLYFGATLALQTGVFILDHGGIATLLFGTTTTPLAVAVANRGPTTDDVYYIADDGIELCTTLGAPGCQSSVVALPCSAAGPCAASLPQLSAQGAQVAFIEDAGIALRTANALPVPYAPIHDANLIALTDSRLVFARADHRIQGMLLTAVSQGGPAFDIATATADVVALAAEGSNVVYATAAGDVVFVHIP
jgi:hypothetical protein